MSLYASIARCLTFFILFTAAAATTASEENEYDASNIGHLLPEPSLFWAKAKMYFAIYVALSAHIAFLVCLGFRGTSLFHSSRASCYFLTAQIVWNFLLAIGAVLIFYWIDYPLTNMSSEDCFRTTLCALGMGMGLEMFVSFLQPSIERLDHSRTSWITITPGAAGAAVATNNNKEGNRLPAPPGTVGPARSLFLFPPLTWRFSWFLLYLGSSCIRNGYKTMVSGQYQFEYLGPMRVTKLPSLSFLEKAYPYTDQFELFPCLLQHPDVTSGKEREWEQGISQPSVIAVLEIGWGKRWGCRARRNTDKWNTNRPQWTPCTTFVCRDDGTSTCACYPDEESARNATLECLEQTFDWTLLKENETYDPEQPPWEDSYASPWPTVTKYGNCNSNVGTSMDRPYIDKVQRHADQQWRFGMVVLLAWYLSLRNLRGRWIC